MRIVTGLIVALLFCTASSLAAESATSVTPRCITVGGTADSLVIPDQAAIRVGLVEKDKKLPVAKEHCDADLQKVVAAADKFGLRRDDIQIGRVSVDREYDHDQHGQVTGFKDFALHRDITLILRDLSRFEELLDVLFESAPLECSYSYRSSVISDVLNTLRLHAVRAAREKAGALAQEAGARLGPVLQISEFPPNVRRDPDPYFDGIARQSGMVVASPKPLQPQVTYYVTFALE